MHRHCRYVASDNVNLVDPSITATANGSAVITGSLVGTGYFLSAFYAHLNIKDGARVKHTVSGLGNESCMQASPGSWDICALAQDSCHDGFKIVRRLLAGPGVA